MEVLIKSQQRIPGLGERKIRRRLRRVLDDLACHEGELSVLFTDDAGMAELNRRYRGKAGPTNVLAFPLQGGPSPGLESGMLGDVVVSVDTALRESRALDEPLEETVYRLLIHGLLHLLAYDHERSEEDASRMADEERRLLALIRED
jgi:rRNA maturation RNase YbeY